MRVVLCNGVFDVLHVGHIRHLQQAKTFGDYLVVSVTEDQFVNKKPGMPWNTLNDRVHVLWSLKCVDRVIATDHAVSAIRLIKPALFVKGIDYSDGGIWTEDVEAACKEVGAIIQFTTTPKTSVSDIMRKANERTQRDCEICR